MQFVVDASVAICLLMPDEHDAVADAILARLVSDEAVVPGIWWYEVRNALIINERRGRLASTLSNSALALLGRLPLSTDVDQDESALMNLSRRHRLTIYDAAYVELALRRGLDLATLDASMTKAALAEGVPLLISG